MVWARFVILVIIIISIAACSPAVDRSVEQLRQDFPENAEENLFSFFLPFFLF